MNRAVLALLFVTVSSSVGAQPTGIQRVSWLQGCWETVSGERTVEEQWMPPRGRSMIGVSRTVRADSLVAYEFIVLREQGDQLAYQAHPSGQPSAVFLSRTITSSSVLFENAQHDFPQRIGYQRDAPDSLAAWIEGTENGKQRRIDFPYRRKACAESAAIDRDLLEGAWTSDGGSFEFAIGRNTILYEFDMKEHPYELYGDVLVVDFQDPTIGIQRTRILRLTKDELELSHPHGGSTVYRHVQ